MKRKLRRGLLRACAVVAPLGTALAVGAPCAQAADLSRYGARVGFSLDPDQLTLGAYGTLAHLTPNVAFRPSADIGFGSNVLTLIGNADVQYSFNTSGRTVPFAGAGVAVLWYDPERGDSDTEIGLNLYGGVELALRGYKTAVLEVRLGLDDQIPDLKFTYGFGFY
ncbi:MAG: hypothetical protein DHS20C21_03840 [Gemmatimonadota bacterium]|nr:MAG: hypothetical protein DHS20C21_03840 [Gemmatimonadota bacterium]